MNPKVYWIAGGVAIVGLAAWYFWPQIRAKLYGSEGSFDMGWLNKRYNALYSPAPPPKPPVRAYKSDEYAGRESRDGRTNIYA